MAAVLYSSSVFRLSWSMLKIVEPIYGRFAMPKTARGGPEGKPPVRPANPSLWSKEASWLRLESKPSVQLLCPNMLQSKFAFSTRCYEKTETINLVETCSHVETMDLLDPLWHLHTSQLRLFRVGSTVQLCQWGCRCTHNHHRNPWERRLGDLKRLAAKIRPTNPEKLWSFCCYM